MMLGALAFAAALMGAQDAVGDPDCLDDNLTDRCAVAEQVRVRTLLGMASIEDELAGGAKVYRAFYVDGYGRDMPAISFERRPSASPQVVVYGPGGQRMVGAVSSATWDTVVRRSRNATTALARPEPEADDEEIICLHSWVSTVEVAETNGPRPVVRRRTEDSCNGGTTVEYAFALAELAIAALPACDRLDPDQHRNDVTRLRACLLLEGDTVAAAGLMNAKGEPPRARDKPTEAEWKVWLGGDTGGRLNWNGQVVEEPKVYVVNRPQGQSVAAFIAERVAEQPGLTLYQARFGATGPDAGWIEGEIAYDLPDGESGYMTAPYRQSWRLTSGEWTLVDWTVGAFTRMAYPE